MTRSLCCGTAQRVKDYDKIIVLRDCPTQAFK